MKNKDSYFVEATSKCSPLTTTTCAIEMSLFWVSPFTLSITGTNIEFKVYTLNSLGISDDASAAFWGGARIQTVPDAPISAPSSDSSSES